MEFSILPQERFKIGLRDLWNFRELFYFFTWRDIKVKYKQTFLGFAWVVIQPLIMTLIFTLFLGDIISEKVVLSVPYPVFVLSGMILWNVFSNGLTSAASSMVSNAHIIKKIYFPRLIIPMSSILVAIFDFLVAFLVFTVYLFFSGIAFHWQALFFIPLAIIITFLSSFGLGTLLSALNLKYRDFRYIVPFLIQALLFITPVIYPSNITTNYFLRLIMKINPMTAAIDIFRASFIDNYHLSSDLLLSLLVSVILFFIGLIYFRKTEYYFADIA